MPVYKVKVTSTDTEYTLTSDADLEVMIRVFGSDLSWAETGHRVKVVVERARYPFRPVCSCGLRFRGYAARHAAQDVADAHAAEYTE